MAWHSLSTRERAISTTDSRHASPADVSQACYAIYYEFLSRHLALDSEQRVRLQALQESPKRARKGDIIKSARVSPRHLLALQTGWACAYRLSESGDRQIIDLYLPGDIIGLRDDDNDDRYDEVVMLTEGLLVPLPKAQLERAMATQPALVNAVLGAVRYQSHIIAERLHNLISHDASARLAYLLLELHTRLGPAAATPYDLRLPISQQVMGDLLGMTNVHVCRCFHQLETQGLLARQGSSRAIRFMNYPGLKRLAGFGTACGHAQRGECRDSGQAREVPC